MKANNFGDVLSLIPRLTKEEREQIQKEEEAKKLSEKNSLLARKWSYFKSNMPKKLERTRLAPFINKAGRPSDNQIRIIEDIKNNGLLQPKSSVFHGTVGLGKTWFSSALGRGWMINNLDKWCRFITESDFVKVSKNSDHFFNDVCTDDILIFDDVTGDGENGMLEKWDAKKVRQMLFDRFENNRITVITTNMSIEALKEYLGNRIWSRMRGTKTTFINFGNSQDLREVV